MEEQQAIRLLKAGDLVGLDVLSQLYYFRAVKTAYLIVQDRDEAEDIVQNGFLHAFEKIDQLSSDRFGPWFLRSIVHASIRVAKKQANQVSINAETGEDALSLEDLLVDRQLTPENQVEMNELSQEIWQALGRLPGDQRAAVVLKYFLEMSEVEITTELNRPVSTIKWWLFTARTRLKDLLRPSLLSPEQGSKQSPSISEKQK